MSASKYLDEFYENGIFHVYNRTNNKEVLFRSDENKRYFLQQYKKYLNPFLGTFCWNLLPNHFHFMIRIKAQKEIISHLKSLQTETHSPTEKKFLNGEAHINELIEAEWTRFFTSYSMAYNKQYSRSGNLFHRPFKRLEIKQDQYFTQLVIYIHANAVKHKIVADIYAHKWSSLHTVLDSKPTSLLREELINWFGGLENLIKIHIEQTAFYYKSDFEIE
jgi:putative transposase